MTIIQMRLNHHISKSVGPREFILIRRPKRTKFDLDLQDQRSVSQYVMYSNIINMRNGEGHCANHLNHNIWQTIS